MDWQPHPGPQTEFCSRGEFEVLFGGAAGPGKTDCLVIEAARHAGTPGYKGLLLRRTYPRLQEIFDRCWKYYPQLGGEFKSTEKRWYWGRDSFIQLGHMQHEDDKHDYQGKEFTFIGVDELTQFTETQYLYLHSRARSTETSVPIRIRCTTNPGGIGHNWVKERFVDAAAPGQTFIDKATGQSRTFIPATVHDNPTLFDNDPNYVRRLEALPEVERKRLLLGIWDVFEGQVFVELSQRTHGCDPFPIPPEWEKWMAFDWGYSKPWCALWFAVDLDGVVYLYREKYGSKDGKPIDVGAKMTNTDIARAILACETEKVRIRVADPACWSPTKVKGSNKVHGPSFIEDAQREGLFFLKADNDRLRGKQQVHQRLKLEETVNPETGEVEKEAPRMVAFNDLENWWRTMLQLREDPKNIEDVDTDQEDHLYDVTRYGVMLRPIVPRRAVKELQGTFASERKRLLRAKEFSRRHGVSLAAAYQRIR